MSKQEILNALRAAGELDNRQRSRNWEQAFDAYNADPENRYNKVTMSCPTCWNHVKNWLLK